MRGAKPGQSRSTPHASPRRQHPPARTLRVPRHHGAADAPASARDRRGRSVDMLHASPRNATRSPARRQPLRWGERSVSEPRFPISLRGTTTAYVASANANEATRRVRPGRHVPAARDPSTSAGGESSQGSAGELPPATSHGYAEWDFSGVPDLVMFRRFLEATDY
jgi:hypothetical protein